MHTTQGAGRGLVQMLLMLSHELGQTQSALSQPLVAAPLIESVIRTLLLARRTRTRGIDDVDVKISGSQVRSPPFRPSNGIQTSPLTVSLLAAQSHVTERALQQGFRRHMGMSPMAYLRQVRPLRGRLRDPMENHRPAHCAGRPSSSPRLSLARETSQSTRWTRPRRAMSRRYPAWARIS
jgi:AraC-like DNA-binding protein